MSDAISQKVQEESGQIAKQEAQESGPSVTEEEMMNEEEMPQTEEGTQQPEAE
jgi:hypothetical protein